MEKPTRARIMGRISALQARKKRLEDLLSLAPFKNPTIFCYGDKGRFISLDQSMIDFNLSFEFELLLRAGINDLEIEICNQEILLQ